MLFDPRPFLAWWANRKSKTDPNFREGRKRVFLTIVFMLIGFAILPEWLVLTAVIGYWVCQYFKPTHNSRRDPESS